MLTLLGIKSDAEIVIICSFAYVKTADSSISVIKLCIFAEQNISEFLYCSQFSSWGVSFGWWIVFVIEERAIRISISVELCLQEGVILICVFDFSIGERIHKGRSIFSMSTSSISGARLTSPIRFFLILEGGIVSARLIADLSFSRGEACAAWSYISNNRGIVI